MDRQLKISLFTICAAATKSVGEHRLLQYLYQGNILRTFYLYLYRSCVKCMLSDVCSLMYFILLNCIGLGCNLCTYRPVLQ